MNCTEQQFLDAIQAEEERLDFIHTRDGFAAAVQFAYRTHSIYCQAMSSIKNMASSREHMHKYFASCVVFEEAMKVAEAASIFPNQEKCQPGKHTFGEKFFNIVEDGKVVGDTLRCIKCGTDAFQDTIDCEVLAK